jgi:excisionase family DNA binding protein
MDANESTTGEVLPAYDETVADVARHFGVSERTVLRWCENTGIPHRRIGGTVRFNLPEVDSWAARGGRPLEESA